MVQSMTGFSSVSGQVDAVGWTIEIRGVNAKGLDVRMRLPEKLLANEAAFKLIFTKKFTRGNINISVRVDTSAQEAAVHLDDAVIEAFLAAAIQIRSKAKNLGLKLAPSTAADILGLRGSLRSGDERGAALPVDQIAQSLSDAADAFEATRVDEGKALEEILSGQANLVEQLVGQAASLAEARRDQVAQTLRANLATVMENSEGADESRVSQELALLAIKADVTEEIDRLRAHVAAARSLLAQDGSIGRKFDFLMQEFNREANTLCSKSQNIELTQVGLDLKATIDQMREQVQNVE